MGALIDLLVRLLSRFRYSYTSSPNLGFNIALHPPQLPSQQPESASIDPVGVKMRVLPPPHHRHPNLSRLCNLKHALLQRFGGSVASASSSHPFSRLSTSKHTHLHIHVAPRHALDVGCMALQEAAQGAELGARHRLDGRTDGRAGGEGGEGGYRHGGWRESVRE
jgi:hypothetical protein